MKFLGKKIVSRFGDSVIVQDIFISRSIYYIVHLVKSPYRFNHLNASDLKIDDVRIFSSRVV